MKHLPAFGRRAELYDFGGAPVSLDPDAPGVPANLAWDVVPPRAVDPAQVRRAGVPVSFDEFVACVALSRARRPLPPASFDGRRRIEPDDLQPPVVQAAVTVRTGWTVELLSQLR